MFPLPPMLFNIIFHIDQVSNAQSKTKDLFRMSRGPTKDSTPGYTKGLQAIVVDTCRTLIVVIGARHVTLALALINHEDDFRCDLCTQEG